MAERESATESANRPTSPRSSPRTLPLYPLPASLPAWACALRLGEPPASTVRATLGSFRQIAQVYRVHEGAPEVQAASAAHAVSHAAERLRRLPAAYGEWGHFDAAAYFDLSRAQAAAVVRVSERVATVHVTFHADLLLPSYRRMLALWVRLFPLWQGSALTGERFEHLFGTERAALAASWEQAQACAGLTRRALASDIGFLAADGAADEQWHWARGASPPGVTLWPALIDVAPAAIPTLTLAIDFPLPAWRQPDRIRRLRRNRDRRARAKRVISDR